MFWTPEADAVASFILLAALLVIYVVSKKF